MRKTTLEMKSLRAKRRYSDEMPGCPKIHNHSLLEHFYAFVRGIPEKGLKDSKTELYVRITNFECMGSAVFVNIESGNFGDNGKVYDTDTGVMKYPKKYADSMTTTSRVVMYQPPEANMVMVAVEKTSGSRGFFLLSAFTAAMKQYDNSYTYITGNVYEAEDWVESSDLIRISATAYKKNYSHREGLGERVFTADVVRSLTPPKGEGKFADWIKKKIFDRQIDAVTLLDLPDDLEKKATVTLVRDGTTKTIEIGKAGAPIYREVLTEDGEPPLDDSGFLMKAAESAASRYSQVDLKWSSSYEQGDWSEDQLAFRWEEYAQAT